MGYIAGRLVRMNEVAAAFLALGALLLYANGALVWSAHSAHRAKAQLESQLDDRYGPLRNERVTDCRDPEVLLVVANWSYDVSWLDEQPFCYVLVQRLVPAATYNIPWNKGFEHPSYLQFIIDRYDSLPRKMVFLHSHRTSWHQADMVDILWNLRTSSHTFASVSGIWNTGIDVGNYCSLKGFYQQLGLERWLEPLPLDNNAVQFMCCSQFIVTRKRIRSNPLALYVMSSYTKRATPLISRLLPLASHLSSRFSILYSRFSLPYSLSSVSLFSLLLSLVLSPSRPPSPIPHPAPPIDTRPCTTGIATPLLVMTIRPAT
jgi:hypothetical protein